MAHFNKIDITCLMHQKIIDCAKKYGTTLSYNKIKHIIIGETKTLELFKPKHFNKIDTSFL